MNNLNIYLINTSIYFYKLKKRTCTNNSAKNGSIVGFEYISGEDKIQYAINFIGPVVVFINIDNLKDYKGGIYNNPSCSFTTNHALLAVGYGTDPTTGLDYWILKNSWGNWG